MTKRAREANHVFDPVGKEDCSYFSHPHMLKKAYRRCATSCEDCETCALARPVRDTCALWPATVEVPPSDCMARGQRDCKDWWRKTSHEKVLGDAKTCMQSFAHHCLRTVATPKNGTLRVLSLSDGNVYHSEEVPTSILLAHAFASLDIYSWPPGIERVKIFGADVSNPIDEGQSQKHWKGLPHWIELQHVHLDNLKNFKPQLNKFAKLCQHSAKFDIVLMRQGLCYCKDHSFDCLPPMKLVLSGVPGTDNFDGPSGTYILEKDFRYGRPSYRKAGYPNCLLHWRPDRSDWVVVEDSKTGFVWANVVHNSGSPASAKSPWYVWDDKQKDYVQDLRVSCDVAGSSQPARHAHACTCCGGISLDAVAMQSFIERVAAVLDERQPKAFALLLSGHYEGFRHETEMLQAELHKAAVLFNSTSPFIHATILRKLDAAYGEPIPYWRPLMGCCSTSGSG